MFTGLVHPEVSQSVCLSLLGICGHCHRPNAASTCSGCGCSHYCSRQCQKSDWKQHKPFCGVLGQYRAKTWEQDVKAAVAKMEQKLLIESSDNTADEQPTTASATKEDSQAIFERAVDLQIGQVGYVKARDRLVAAAGKLDPAEVFSGLKAGPRNLTLAKKLLLKAANAGHKGAMYDLASFNLEDGSTGHKDEMLKWCLRAAVNGHAEAQMTMGSHYWYRGNDGHPIDHTKALLWKRLAVAHGAIEFPDPCGDFLSANSFRSGLKDLANEGRTLYLRKWPFRMGEDGHEEEVEMEMKLAASCGCNGAIVNEQLVSR